MRRSVLAALLTFSAAGCGYTGGGMDNSGAPLSMTTVDEITVPGDFQTLASCAYASYAKWAGAGLNKVDLPPQKSSQVFLETGGGVRYWQVDFKGVEGNQTQVKLSVLACFDP